MNRREALFHSLSAVLSGVLAWLVPGRTKPESLTVCKGPGSSPKFLMKIPFTSPIATPDDVVYVGDRMDPWPICRAAWRTSKHLHLELWYSAIEFDRKHLAEVFELTVKVAELHGASFSVSPRGNGICRLDISIDRSSVLQDKILAGKMLDAYDLGW